MTTVNFFQNELDNMPAFQEKLDMLLTWSVTTLQYGDHRPFAAITLIRLWRDRACERATRRGTESPNDFLQDQLFDWLDTSEVAEEAKNLRDVALLYGELVKEELFSYTKYIQRLIARGEPGLSFTEVGLLSVVHPIVSSTIIDRGVETSPIFALDPTAQFYLPGNESEEGHSLRFQS
jgi:mediator of RNA polymerase II transcription subunit 12